MEKSTKILLAASALALATAYLVGRNSAKKRGYANTTFGATIFGVPKKAEEKANIGGRHGGGHRPRVGIRNIYGGSYAFPYTPLYGYDQCSYVDKNGAVLVAPCNQGWARAW